jgi:hypothetical protein
MPTDWTVGRAKRRLRRGGKPIRQSVEQANRRLARRTNQGGDLDAR